MLIVKDVRVKLFIDGQNRVRIGIRVRFRLLKGRRYDDGE